MRGSDVGSIVRLIRMLIGSLYIFSTVLCDCRHLGAVVERSLVGYHPASHFIDHNENYLPL